MTSDRLVVDVGGTWARFALSERPGALRCLRQYPTAASPSFEAALEAYIADTGAGPAHRWCTSAHLAAAGPVEAGAVNLTNAAWRIVTDDVSRMLGGANVTVVNDLEAVALLLPHLEKGDAARIGSVDGRELAGNRIAINVGTGFGAATAVCGAGGAWTAVASEAGHMAYAAARPDEAALLGHKETVEHILSGAGIVGLYELLAEGRSALGAPESADEVFGRAATDPVAARVVRLVTRILARVAGDLVLAASAWGGVYLCGSVVHGWLPVADVSEFRAVFEQKGCMRERMVRVGTHLLVKPEPALHGLSHAPG